MHKRCGQFFSKQREMKLLTCYILTSLLTIYCGQAFGQSDVTRIDEDKAHFIISAGISYQKELVGELGFIYGYSAPPGPCTSGNLRGLKFATEFNFNSDNFFIAPKVGVEFDYLILGARLNIIDYTDFTYHDFKFTPEIGLSLMGAFDIFYGYNYSLTDKRIENIGTNRITLTINFDRVLWGREQ